MSQTPENFDENLRAAESVAAEANLWRTETRWKVKKADPDRRAAAQAHLDAIDDAMKPIRSYIGSAVHRPLATGHDRRLRTVSTALQYERRQIKKMVK